MKLKRIIKLLIIIIWLIIIFMFSAQKSNDSLEVSNNFLTNIVEFINRKELSEEQKQTITEKYLTPIRKTAHFFLYFVLSVLIMIYLQDLFKTKYKMVLITIVLCVIYAITDELHQSFVPGRAGRAFDVFIDSLGATFGAHMFFLSLKFKEKIIKNK